MSARPSVDRMVQERLMREAVAVCREGIAGGNSPFGTVIARPDGTIVARCHNRVRDKDSAIWHAEIQAIEVACGQVGHCLKGLVLFSTTEPCPMCAAAIHWAQIDEVYFGATIRDAAGAGFNELSVPCGTLYAMGGSRVKSFGGVLEAECRGLFEEWKRGPRPEAY